MDDGWIGVIVSGIFGAIMGSSGFWAWFTHREKKQNAANRLLMGLAYAELTQRGMGYIDRGWITADEFEEFRNIFYEPYKALGGNGLGDRIMHDVESLPFRNPRLYIEVSKARAEQEQKNERKQSEGFTRASIEQPFL